MAVSWIRQLQGALASYFAACKQDDHSVDRNIYDNNEVEWFLSILCKPSNDELKS